MSNCFSITTFQRMDSIFLSQQISISISISQISAKQIGPNMNKSSQIVCTFKSYQWASKSLIRFITDIVQEWMQILLKIHYKQSAYTTTDNLRTTHLKTGNELKKLTYNLHSPSQKLRI